MRTVLDRQIRFILFDWGDTLMSEDGPVDRPMAHWPQVRAMDGALEVVTSLSKRFRLAIVTNATVSKRPHILHALHRVGLDSFFSEIFCYTEIGKKKDEPEFWRIVLTSLGAVPTQVMVVGDSLEQDVLAPMKFGLRAVWFNWKCKTAPTGIDLTSISRLSELLSVTEVG